MADAYGVASRPTAPARARTSDVTVALADVVVLVRDTVTVFVRLFPQLVAVFLLGWLGDALAVRFASIVGDTSGWAALVVFSSSFLFTLVAVVVILRLCGRELGISELVPREGTVVEERDSSMSRLVAVTLLPFLGLYSAFGLVDQKAGQLATEQLFRNGALSGGPSVLTDVRGLATNHPWWMLALLVGLYVVRRLLDLLHERTGLRPLGLLTAVVESLFILVVIYGGFLLLQRPRRWLSERRFVEWVQELGGAVLQALSFLHVRLPDLVRRLGSFLVDPVGDLLWTVVSQPIIWLAVAALVYGSQVLSLADLWRKGRPATARVLGSSRFDRRSDKRGLLTPVAPAGVRRVGGEVREAFLGDIDDKYLPTFHSLRLVLRAGPVFLGSFVLVYTAIAVARSGVERLYLGLIGGRDITFWYEAGPLLDLVDVLPWEPLRLCLLAVAFRRCLELFHQRVDGVEPARPGGAAPAPTPAASGTGVGA